MNISEPEQKPRRNIKKLLFNIFLTVVTLCSLFICTNIFTLREGYSLLKYESDLNEPLFSKHVSVFINNTNFDNVQEENVITFHTGHIERQPKFHPAICSTLDRLDRYVMKDELKEVSVIHIVTKIAFLIREVWYFYLTFPTLSHDYSHNGLNLVVLFLGFIIITLVILIILFSRTKRKILKQKKYERENTLYYKEFLR